MKEPYLFPVATYAAPLLLLVLLLLLVFFWNDIIQEAEVVLGEHVVHGFSDHHQSQDLKKKKKNTNREDAAIRLISVQNHSHPYSICNGGPINRIN